MHLSLRFIALISTVYVIFCHIVHEAGGADERNIANRTPGFQAFSPGNYGQRQLAAGLDKSVARSIAAGFRVANDASKFGNQFTYSETLPPNTGSMNFQKRMDRPGIRLPIRSSPVFPADRSFIHEQVSRLGGGFQNGNYWNTDLWPAERMQLFNAPSANSNVPGMKIVDSSSHGSSTNVEMTDPILEKQIIKSRNHPLEKSAVESKTDVNGNKRVQNQSQVDKSNYSDFLSKNTRPKFPPRKFRGRKRNNWRRFGVPRNNNWATAEVSLDLTPKIENKVDGVSDGTLSDDGITTSFTTTEVTIDSSTKVFGDTSTEIDEDSSTEVVVDTATEIVGNSPASFSGKSDAPATTTEEVVESALSSFMEATTDRICLPPAVEDMKMVLSGLVPNGSVSMTTLPKVVADLVSRVRDAYPKLSPSEVAAQAFTELCTALLHVLSHSPSTGSNVNYDTIPETAQIVSLMIQSGFDT